MIRFHSWPLISPLIWRAAALTLLWGALTSNTGWRFGAVVIIVATLAGQAFAPAQPTPWSLTGLVLFLAYFIKESLRAGIDVAYRALHPDLPVKPAWLHYPLRLPPGPGRVLFACAVNLQPGTLSADLQGDDLTIHLLIKRPDTQIKLKTLEERVAALFLARLSTRSTKETSDD